MIGAMSTLGFVIIVLLGFLWVWLLSKKERAAKRYTEVKKQVHKEPSKLNSSHAFLFTKNQGSKFFSLFSMMKLPN